MQTPLWHFISFFCVFFVQQYHKCVCASMCVCSGSTWWSISSNPRRQILQCPSKVSSILTFLPWPPESTKCPSTLTKKASTRRGWVRSPTRPRDKGPNPRPWVSPQHPHLCSQGDVPECDHGWVHVLLGHLWGHGPRGVVHHKAGDCSAAGGFRLGVGGESPQRARLLHHRV